MTNINDTNCISSKTCHLNNYTSEFGKHDLVHVKYYVVKRPSSYLTLTTNNTGHERRVVVLTF